MCFFCFFLKRCNKGSFKTVREGARGQGRVDESSDKRKESIEIFHKKRCSNQSSLQVLKADFKMKLQMTSSETGWKVQKRAPSNGSGTGKHLRHTD